MDLRAQVILHTDNATPEDYVTNSWCVTTTGTPTTPGLNDFTVAFKDFYDDLASFLGATIAQNGHEVKYYDLNQLVPPNYPILEDTFNLTSNPGIDGMPSEVALCLSFQGEKVPGFPQARRRGRIYFGPIVATATAGGRPTSGLVTALSNAGDALATALPGNTMPANLAVWSVADGAAVPVTDGWVDNAFDTQRRRGVDRTSRTTWAV